MTEPSRPHSDPLIGTLVANRYRIHSILGSGGMGSVYRAEHEALRKPIALKVLKREFSEDRDMLERFKREAVAAAHIEHPNVAQAFDHGALPDGALYLAMELIEGKSLRAAMREGRIDRARAAKIVRQVGGGLSKAHAAGVVHRDLKPENIVLAMKGNDEVVKVIDFGIARVPRGTFGVEGQTALTKVGEVFGTPAYMAPEQAMGMKVDAKADQYALGVLAFELFTGQTPFQSDDPMELVQMQVGVDPPNASSLDPSLPPALDEVLQRMLAKLPRERYDSVADASKALDEALGMRASTVSLPNVDPASRPSVVLASAPTLAMPLVTARAHTPTNDSKKRMLMLAAALALLSTCGAGAWIVARASKTPTSAADNAPHTTQREGEQHASPNVESDAAAPRTTPRPDEEMHDREDDVRREIVRGRGHKRHGHGHGHRH